MRAARGKPYRRSWKNLLLNKRYQLGFTLSMVGLSTVLMAFLGYWVMHEAKRATTVAIGNVEGQRCPPLPEIPSDNQPSWQPSRVIIDEISPMTPPPVGEPAAPSGDADGEPAAPSGDADGEPSAAAEGEVSPEADPAGEVSADAEAAGETDGDQGAEDPEGDGEGGEDGAQEGERSRPRVTLDEGTMRIEAADGDQPNFVEAVVQNYRCQHGKIAKTARIQAGYRLILGVLIGVGVFLIFGLTFWGIKMTHHLAGPLYKVELYFAKMREGRFDEVYDLRKGDQLVEFYEQFKAAHHGIKRMQRADIDALRAAIEAADEQELGARSPELAAVLDELREALARKEKSLE
ncbi:MAG: hypothetical protein Tsb0020_33660 [Haliangiales bacterium]